MDMMSRWNCLLTGVLVLFILKTRCLPCDNHIGILKTIHFYQYLEMLEMKGTGWRIFMSMLDLLWCFKQSKHQSACLCCCLIQQKVMLWIRKQNIRHRTELRKYIFKNHYSILIKRQCTIAQTIHQCSSKKLQ